MARYEPSQGVWNPSPEVYAAGQAAQVRYTGGREYCGTHTTQASIPTGTRALRNWMVQNWSAVVQTYMPGRGRDITGCVHLDVHHEGRAIDFMRPGGAEGNEVMEAIASWLVSHADEVGVQEVLYNKTAWFAGDGPGGNRWHSWEHGDWGGSDHSDHVHTSLTPEGAAGSTPWFSTPTGMLEVVETSPWTAPLLVVTGLALATGVYILIRSSGRRQGR